MSLTTRQLRDLFRSRIDDPESPGEGDSSDCLWSNAEIYQYMDIAQKRFARDTYILKDSTTSSVCAVTVTADTATVSLSPLIIDIERARLASSGRYLTLRKIQDMQDEEVENSYDYGFTTLSKWEDVTGSPRILIMNWEEDVGRLAPVPVDNDTINLSVVRLPLEDITGTNVDLEVTNTEYQYVMLEYMMHLAYGKHDADTYDPQKEADKLDVYEFKVNKIKKERQRLYQPMRPVQFDSNGVW